MIGILLICKCWIIKYIVLIYGIENNLVTKYSGEDLDRTGANALELQFMRYSLLEKIRFGDALQQYNALPKHVTEINIFVKFYKAIMKTFAEGDVW